ncbi:MAG: hypothetical protein K0B02_04050 [DPANN group archaeon]|nr:hypothetical protein [DPANN group archaeon]
MYIFGFSVDLLDLITMFFVVLVLYIVILEYEFKEIIKIVKNYDNQETALKQNITELREELDTFKKK